uniref:Uncharacterized protein n=1 Tax=Steinernema glaseri TaxID=37863 RepID=A0A1I7XVX5_9BILA
MRCLWKFHIKKVRNPPLRVEEAPLYGSRGMAGDRQKYGVSKREDGRDLFASTLQFYPTTLEVYVLTAIVMANLKA